MPHKGEYLSSLGGQGTSRHTSSYLHANSCCPDYESFPPTHENKSRGFSIWQHPFAGFMAHEMARESDLLFGVFNCHNPAFAFHFIGHPGLGAFVRAPIAVWAGGEEEVVNGTSVLSELGMRE